MSSVTASLVATDDPSVDDVLLTAAWVAGPLVSLVGAVAVAGNDWRTDATSGAVQVVGSILYSLTLLAVAERTPKHWRLRAALVLCLVVGLLGNVAHGFAAINGSLGQVPVVDPTSAALVVEPLRLFFPVALLLAAVVLARLACRRPAALVAAGAGVVLLAHLGDAAWLAAAGHAVLVVGFAAARRGTTSG